MRTEARPRLINECHSRASSLCNNQLVRGGCQEVHSINHPIRLRVNIEQRRPDHHQSRGSGTAIQQSHVSKAAALTLIDFGSNFKPTPHNRFGQSIGELKQQREEGANHWGIEREYRESHPECTESTANVFVILIGGWEQQEEMVVSL